MSRPSPRARRPKAAARDSGPSRDLERKQQLLQPGPPFPSPAAPPHAFASPGQPLLPRGPGRPPGCGGPVRAGRQERYSEANGYGNWLPRQSRCPTLQPPPVSHGSPGLQRGKLRDLEEGGLGHSGEMGVSLLEWPPPSGRQRARWLPRLEFGMPGLCLPFFPKSAL